MKSSDFIERNHLDILSCVQNCFDDSSCTVREGKAQLHETVHNLISFRDRASYIVNTWEGCRYAYEDTTRRTAGALEQGDQQRLPEQCHDFTMNNERATKPIAVFAAIQAQVHKAMDVLAKEIKEYDHQFACEVIPVGSAHEGTKIGCCDEFDYNFVLTNLSSICEVCYSPASPPGFVLLKASKPVHDEHLKDLFDENGILNTRVVKFKFEHLAKQVLSSASFCNLTDFEFIDSVNTHTYVGITSGNTTAKLNTQIKLTFTKPVNGYHVMHTISVDIVPVLHITDWWPETARQRELCRPDECLIVFTQPQSKYPWIGWTQPRGFVSFAPAESRLLRDCHPVAKAAYMVVKRMSMYFCGSELFASHTIKMALLWCLDKKDLTKYRSSNRDDEINGHELLCLVQNILRRLLCFAAQDYVPSYFMEKCHQPVWPKERYLKQFHTRLYQHGLTYKDLFSLNEQQSRDRVLQSIKSLFTYSHIMYWTVLSDTDDLGKLFVPSTINPLREISYDAVK